jgi:hypothetical protein
MWRNCHNRLANMPGLKKITRAPCGGGSKAKLGGYWETAAMMLDKNYRRMTMSMIICRFS